MFDAGCVFYVKLLDLYCVDCVNDVQTVFYFSSEWENGNGSYLCGIGS